MRPAARSRATCRSRAPRASRRGSRLRARPPASSIRLPTPPHTSRTRAAEQEADDEVRARRAPHIETDGANERRHTQGPEDHSDRAAEHSDPERERTSSSDAQTLAWARGYRSKREVDPAPHEHSCDQPIQERFRDVVRDERARDRPGDRRRRRPGDHAPVHATRSSVREPAGARGCRRDRDVRAGRCERAPRCENHERQAQRSQHEPQHRADVAGDERGDER